MRACDDDGAMCECGEGARVIRARDRRDGSEDDAWRDGARAGRDRAEAVGLGLCWVFGG